MAVAATVHRQSSVSSEVRQPQLLARSKSDRQYSRVQTLQMRVEIELVQTSRATPYGTARAPRAYAVTGSVAAGRRSRSDQRVQRSLGFSTDEVELSEIVLYTRFV